MLAAACSSGAPAVASPAPGTPTAVESLPASPSPSPQPLQRAEPSLPALVEETAAAAGGGRLYVMGGFNAAGASLRTVYVFDGERWSAGPRLPLPLDHAAAATIDDRVYVAGGHSNGTDSARLFRLDGNGWTALASMHFARGGHALVAVSGKLYVLGGNTSRANVAAIESYDPSTNRWTVLGSLPQPRNHVMGFPIGAAACVAGGRTPTSARVDCFNTPPRMLFRLGDLPAATSGGGAITFPSGEAIVLGGEDASEGRMIDQVAFYSTGGAWRASQKMLAPRHGFELALFNGRAWACGGGSAPGLHPVATCTSLGDPSTSQG
jgi:Kelch motif protein